MRNFFLFMSFLVYVMLTKYLIEYDFTHFGAYRMVLGALSIDWRGIVYLSSSAFITALLLNLAFILSSKPLSKLHLLLGGLLCDVFFFLHQAVEFGLYSPVSSIQNRPLHLALVNLILFAAPLVSYFVASGMVYLYSMILPKKTITI